MDSDIWSDGERLGSALLFGGSILLAFLGITFNIRFMYLTLLLKVFEIPPVECATIPALSTSHGPIDHVFHHQSDVYAGRPVNLEGEINEAFGREKIQRHSTKRKPPEQDPSSQDSSPSDSSSSELRNGSGDLIVKDEKVVIRAPTFAAPSANKRESSASRSEASSDDNGERPDNPAPEKDSKDPDPPTDDFHYELDAHLGSIKSGVEAIIDDEVTKRFSAEELRAEMFPIRMDGRTNLTLFFQSWNLLTRTNENYAFISVRLTCIWFVGFVFRYAILLPIRVLLTSWAIVILVVGTGLVGSLPNGKIKRVLYERTWLTVFRIFQQALSGGPASWRLLGRHPASTFTSVSAYLVRAKRSEGQTFLFQTFLFQTFLFQTFLFQTFLFQTFLFQTFPIKAGKRIRMGVWDQDAENAILASLRHDRAAVAQRLKDHVEVEDNPPILIFPEGVCINNTSVMQFKKGSFETGATVYPVAMRYDPRFADAFWNNSQANYLQHLYSMFTSWAVVTDVWYLAPMRAADGESAVSFANRVKAEIAQRGGLVDSD
ncbi:unnamed protein product, partial [Cyprideis torosa]